jgi:hypothetical protein
MLHVINVIIVCIVINLIYEKLSKRIKEKKKKRRLRQLSTGKSWNRSRLTSKGTEQSRANLNPSRMRPVLLSWARSSTVVSRWKEGVAMSKSTASKTFQSGGNSMARRCCCHTNAEEIKEK